MKPKAVICDLDGTLCDVRHRRHLVEGQKKDFKAFHKALVHDTPFQDMLTKVIEFEKSGVQIVFVTGRPVTYMDETVEWLSKHFPKMFSFRLYLRPEKDNRPDTEVKAEIYDRCIKDELEVVKVYDDRPSVIRMWREKGLEVEDVGDGVEF